MDGGREGGGRGRKRERGRERILKCLEFSSIVVKGEDQNPAQVTIWQPMCSELPYLRSAETI